MRFLAPALLAVFALTACDPSRATRRYTREEVRGALKRLETVGLELGEFPIDGAGSVVDGDTIKVRGLDASLRLLGIDTEETFKHDEERRGLLGRLGGVQEEDARQLSAPGEDRHPAGRGREEVRPGLLRGRRRSVRLERDHPGEIRDYYGRYLAYVFAFKNGQWVNYNVEAVRRACHPTSSSTGAAAASTRSSSRPSSRPRRRSAASGSPSAMHYDDYDERAEVVGRARAAAITRFEKEMAEHPDSYIALTRWDAMLRLEQKVGRGGDAARLGAARCAAASRGPPSSSCRASARRTSTSSSSTRTWLIASGLQFKQGEYVQVRGKVSKYIDKRGNGRLQLQVTLPGQVLAPSEKLDQLLKDRPADDEQKNQQEGD